MSFVFKGHRCLYCGKLLAAGCNVSRRYCSDRCRVYAWRRDHRRPDVREQHKPRDSAVTAAARVVWADILEKSGL